VIEILDVALLRLRVQYPCGSELNALLSGVGQSDVLNKDTMFICTSKEILINISVPKKTGLSTQTRFQLGATTPSGKGGCWQFSSLSSRIKQEDFAFSFSYSVAGKMVLLYGYITPCA
jgi:hypothetical protein